MRRDITTLAGEEFDLLVVGGGIHGAVTDYVDAGIQGLVGRAGVKHPPAWRVGEEAARPAARKLRRESSDEIPGPLPEGIAQLPGSETLRRLEKGYGAAEEEPGWSRERRGREIAEAEGKSPPCRTGDGEEPEAL